jgi:hypothetical protein
MTHSTEPIPADAASADGASADLTAEPVSDAMPPLSVVAAAVAPPVRKRPKPGERRVQILQMLATMLEQPRWPASSKSRKRRCTATSQARRRCSRA